MDANSWPEFSNLPCQPLYVVSPSTTIGTQFESKLTEIQGLTVKTVPAEHVSSSVASTASGFVYLSSSCSGTGAFSGEGRPESNYKIVEKIVESTDVAELDCPVIAVGSDIDAEAAYRAGATDIIPVSVPENIGTAVERILTIIGRFVMTTQDTTDTTVRRRETENLIEAFSTAFPDYAFVYDENGRYLDMMTGRRTEDRLYTDEELLGRTVHDVLDEDTADRIVTAIRDTLAADEVQNIEYSLDREDGTSWYRARVAPLANPYQGRRAVVLIARDITDRKERERERERGRRRFDALFNHPTSLVTLLDTEGRITKISDAAVALVDVSTEAILGRPLWEGPWFEGDPDLQARLQEVVQRALDGENTRLEADVPLPDSELVIDAMFQPITVESGNITSVLGVARDITEQRRSRRIRNELLSTTQELMTVDTRTEVAEIVSEATTTIFGNELNAVYLSDEETTGTTLAPIAWTEQTEEVLGGSPDPTGTGPATEAYSRGEPMIYDSLDDVMEGPPDQYSPVESLLTVPLGDHGVLGIGATDHGAFDDIDVERYRLLTVNAATALDKVEQRRDLQRYETLFETVQDNLYVLDEDGYIQMVSEPLAERLGYEADTLHGQHVSSMVTKETAKDGERLILDMLVTPDTVSSTYEGQMVTRDGETIPIEIELSILPYEDTFRGTVGAVRDISERRQREQELYVFREAITEAGIGLAMYGPDGCFEYVNDHYADMVGRARDELESSHVCTIFDDLSPEEFDEYWTSFSAGETETTESTHRRGDGSIVPVEMVTTAVEIDGTKHHILTIQDITDRRERRQQAEALHRILRHNLRNDLTVMSGQVALLSEQLPGKYDDTIEKLVETTQGLIDLADTATEARKLLDRATNRHPIDVTDIVREEVADVRTESDATIVLDLPETQYVRADSSLGTAVNHLVTNAVEHNDSGAPEVWVRVRPAPDHENWVAIEIADNGPGIPDIEREPLTSGSEDQLRHGIGMGLWIVQWIVSRYGGDLIFEDRDPRGSRVRIALPVAEHPQADTERAET